MVGQYGQPQQPEDISVGIGFPQLQLVFGEINIEMLVEAFEHIMCGGNNFGHGKACGIEELGIFHCFSYLSPT